MEQLRGRAAQPFLTWAAGRTGAYRCRAPCDLPGPPQATVPVLEQGNGFLALAPPGSSRCWDDSLRRSCAGAGGVRRYRVRPRRGQRRGGKVELDPPATRRGRGRCCWSRRRTRQSPSRPPPMSGGSRWPVNHSCPPPSTNGFRTRGRCTSTWPAGASSRGGAVHDHVSTHECV